MRLSFSRLPKGAPVLGQLGPLPPAGPPVATPGSRSPREYSYDAARRAYEEWRRISRECRRMKHSPYRPPDPRELRDCVLRERAAFGVYWKLRTRYRAAAPIRTVSPWGFLFGMGT